MNNILVTGGTGSFGHAFVRYMLASPYCPERLCVLSRDEFKQSQMRQEFHEDHRLRFFLGDVRDQARLELAFHGVDTIVHAAALKQVPAGEYNPWEFTQTNVIGSHCVLEAARKTGVKRALLLSTDKACAPVTTYGTTKLMAERLFSQANTLGGLCSASTRYGNITDSRGSVIPIWREATAKRQPICVTDPDATRFHMTQDQAVQLVLLALHEMQGGEVFIPKLRSYRLGDLARLVTGQDGKVIGPRPAEKVHEVLVSHDEMRTARDFVDHVRLIPEIHPWRSNGGPEGVALAGYEYGSKDVVMSPEELRTAMDQTVWMAA